MLKINSHRSFKKDLKRYQHQKEILVALNSVISLLIRQQKLPEKNRDHYLTGDWVNHKECHVKNDVLLIYKISEDILYLTRFGSHSELF